MERLHYDVLVEVLAYLNFNDLCCLDIAFQKARLTYPSQSLTINEYYITLIINRNTLLEILDSTVYLNEQDPAVPVDLDDIKFLIPISTIVLLNSIPYANFPSTLMQFLYVRKWGNVAITAKFYNLLKEDKLKILRDFHIRLRLNQRFGRRRCNYFELFSNEVYETIMGIKPSTS